MFTQDTLATVGAQSAPAPSVYSYSSNDSLAQVTAASYFVDKENQFSVGDWILALLSDGHAFLEVSSDTSTVTVVNVAVSTEPVVQRFTTANTINSNTNLVICSATATHAMPSVHEGFLKVKSKVGFTVTLNPGTDTVENGNTVASGANREFFKDGTVWLEL